MKGVSRDDVDDLRSLGWRTTHFVSAKARRGDQLPRKHFPRIKSRDVFITEVGPSKSPSIVDLEECR